MDLSNFHWTREPKNFTVGEGTVSVTTLPHMAELRLYHTGHVEIPAPDVHYGRKNADFGQGFYLSPDGEFVGKWAKERKDAEVVVNVYLLDLDGLNVVTLDRDAAWLATILRNRAGYPDRLAEADVVIGPVANDTIYETFGLLTSGLVQGEQLLELMRLGPDYTQIVLKSEKAAAGLRFVEARRLSHEEIAAAKAQFGTEQAAYQQLLGEAMERLSDGERRQ